jgi:hypothetical protein
MDTLSKLFMGSSSMNKVKKVQSLKRGGLASTRPMIKMLPNTRNKMYKLFRDTSYAIPVTPNVKRIQSYPLPQNMVQNKPLKLRKSPSPKKLNSIDDIDDLINSIGVLNINKSKNKSPSPNAINADDINDLVNMFGKVKLKPKTNRPNRPVQKKTNTKSKTKTQSNSRRTMKNNDDDMLSSLFEKKMKIGNKKQMKQPQQPLRRSSRTIKQPERYTDKPNERKSQRNDPKQQNKRIPMQLSPIQEEKTKQKKQRRNG